ncbi:MAG: LysE family translocator [Pseudomonadota bacterium]
MSFDTWLSFALASMIVLLIPSPTILLVTSYTLSHGKRAALASVGGVALGDAVAICLSLVGLGAIIAASATLFIALKWVGAAYLIYLGIQKWRTKPQAMTVGGGPQSIPPYRLLIRQSFTVTVLNPKSIAFFIAFLPQFMIFGAPMEPHMGILATTFVALAVANAILYVFAADFMRRAIRRPAVLQWAERLSGSILIGAGVMTATLRRST